MITMVTKGKKHRELIRKKLLENTKLTENSTIIIHENKPDKKSYVGQTTHSNIWQDNYPTMDLYSNHYFELVAETRYEKVHHFSEKTAKPIRTCTPFLVASTPGYLACLKNMGFQTFSKLFDEGYDTVFDVDQRVDSIIQTLFYIKSKGFQKIYEKTKPVLQHNFIHLQNLFGDYTFANDKFYYCLCKEAGVL
jgi:hypothetical protein